MKTITDRKARSIKPGDKPIACGITGLRLLPTVAAGRGQWMLRFVSPVTGKRRDYSLGIFPDIGVADALEAGREARALIAKGGDPILSRQALRRIPTFEVAARQRWEQVKASFRNEKHRQDWFNSLEQHAFPRLGATRVDMLKPADFAEMLRQPWREVPETASRVKQRCADVMASCWAQGFIPSNPLEVVDRLLPKLKKESQHYPAMPWQVLPGFWADHLREEPLLGARAALAFLILTASRSGEARGCRWEEIDMSEALWTVPADRMKAHREHRVPLSGAALDVLDKQPRNHPSGLVFPSFRGVLLSDMALTAFLRSVEAPSDTEDRRATAHGFRSSFRDWCADTGVNSELAERSLAHTIGNKVRAAYERTDRLAARVALMETWGQYVTGGEVEK